MTRGRRWIAAGVCFVALAASFAVDQAVAEWVARSHPLDKRSALAFVLKLPGNFLYFTLPVTLLLTLFHRLRWRAAVPLLLASGFVGLSYSVLKWAVGRHRPVLGIHPFELHPFASGMRGLVHAERGLSFPSGHAALAFATAAVLSRFMPKWRPAFFLVATGVGAERVLENAHYVSDVVAAAGLAVACAALALFWCHPLPALRRIGNRGSDQ